MERTDKAPGMVSLDEYLTLMHHNEMLQEVINEQDEYIERALGGDDSLTMREVFAGLFIAAVMWVTMYVACYVAVLTAKALGVV